MKTNCFLTFQHQEATLPPVVRVPPYENKASLTNSVIPPPNGKLFYHEQWFFTYKNYPPIDFFTTIHICVGLGHICPTPGEIGLRRNNVIIWAHEFCTFATRYAYLSCINLFMIIKMNDELENQRLKTYPSLYEL